MPLDNPVNCLNVTKTAWALLDVGLEVEGRIVVFGVTGGLLLTLGLEKGGRAPKSLRGECGPKLFQQRFCPEHAAGIKKIGHHRLIGLGLLKALLERANALCGF